MLKIKESVDLKELEKFGFINQYEEYEHYDNGNPISWWNDGRDKEQYRYYRCGYEKYDITLIVNEKDRELYITPPYSEFMIEDTATAINVLYDLIKADMIEKIEGD